MTEREAWLLEIRIRSDVSRNTQVEVVGKGRENMLTSYGHGWVCRVTYGLKTENITCWDDWTRCRSRWYVPEPHLGAKEVGLAGVAFVLSLVAIIIWIWAISCFVAGIVGLLFVWAIPMPFWVLILLKIVSIVGMIVSILLFKLGSKIKESSDDVDRPR